MSISGVICRSGDKKRSNTRRCSMGSIGAIFNRYDTSELAAEPRPWQRMPFSQEETHNIPDYQEIIRQSGDINDGQLMLQARFHM